ncbi:hypothetical protein HK105_203710 [Polyrhizophydium stewartii]|uniref:Poly [ADP-ribose] polymerase n=1 Tax=Polyrhizophydium stewartii TaxID=2732419 RepID=A0ABR4NAN7_9FUNG
MSRRSSRTKAASDAAAAAASPMLFEPFVFAITAKAAREEPTLEKAIKAAGGAVAASVTAKVTHVVALEAELQQPAGKAKTALDKSLPLVSPDFITKSVAEGKLEDIAGYTLKATSGGGSNGGAGSGSAADDTGSAAATAPPAKRKADDAADAAAAATSKDDSTSKPAKKAKGKAAASDKTADDQAADTKAPDAKAAGADDKEPEKKVVAIKKGKSVVDPACPMSKTTHVVERGDEVFDVMLNQTNISANNNKFYVIQLLKDDASPKHYVWTRWGRVGLSGQTSLQPCGSFDMAYSEFCKKFNDKTRNSWVNRKSFVKYPGKYFLIERDFSNDDDDDDDDADAAGGGAGASGDAKPSSAPLLESKLEKPVKELMELIFNLDMMNRQMTEIGYDAKKMPLGKLSKANIQKARPGYEVLKRISDVIQNNTSASRSNQLMELSSEFYTIIPHEFGMSRPPVINTLPMLKTKLDMVEALADIQIAANLIKANNSVTEHPMDVNYRSLMCDLKPIDHSSDTFRLVRDYTSKTHGSTHNSYSLEVLDVFDVGRRGESDRFVGAGYDKMPNRMLLWHGSRLTNFVGILSQGLRIAPPEAPVTGYMFGKGVYFADMVSKSANYCCTNRSSNVGILLLCEVALGTTNNLVNSDYHANTKIDHKTVHSTKGMGRNVPNPAEFVTLDDGVVVPAGKAVNAPEPNLYLQYNEFIVYRVEQIRIRYLVKMKFDYR